MASKNKKNRTGDSGKLGKVRETLNITKGLQEETKYGVLAIIFFVVAIFLSFSAMGLAGVVGNFFFKIFGKLLGAGFFFLPIIFLLGAFSFLRTIRPHILATTITGAILFLLSGLGVTDIIFRIRTADQINGGLIGYFVSNPLLKLFGDLLSTILLTAVAIVAILIIFDTKITLEPKIFGKKLIDKDEWDQPEDAEIVDESATLVSGNDDPLKDVAKNDSDKSKKTSNEEAENKKGVRKLVTDKINELLPISMESEKGIGDRNYNPPPLSLLEDDNQKPTVGDIKANANVIKRTLSNFGIDVEMDEISIGPSITRYAFKPAEGVKVARIVSLQNDLALALAAHPIRIEAPIPGRSLVGIEIPNTVKATVRLASLINTQKFVESDKPLLIPLGKGTSGMPHYSDLSKAPHLLIAGSTGSGKSVTIHTIIASLLYRNSPENLRLIMIDPKRVELTLYNNIPHLLTPVIIEPKKAILALKWVAKEMERRYGILESHSVRDVQSYHKNIFEKAVKLNRHNPNLDKDDNLPEKMPYMVIIIDELADIMTMYPKELEASIVRIAQMARAVGIHLILSTQRPSVEIITGLIKANIPSRIALQVPSQIDSRTIIDMAGAEKLLGAGDMLYLSGEMSKPQRIQSAFISENEVKKITDYLRKNAEPELPQEINFSEMKDKDVIFSQDLGGISSDEDELNAEDEQIYEEARDLVIRSQKASTSYLQRKLKLGYARAARIMDMLEDRGVIGPGEGAKARDVITKYDQGLDEAADKLLEATSNQERENNDIESA